MKPFLFSFEEHPCYLFSTCWNICSLFSYLLWKKKYPATFSYPFRVHKEWQVMHSLHLLFFCLGYAILICWKGQRNVQWGLICSKQNIINGLSECHSSLKLPQEKEKPTMELGMTVSKLWINWATDSYLFLSEDMGIPSNNKAYYPHKD